MPLTFDIQNRFASSAITVSAMPSPFGNLLMAALDGKLCWLQIGEAETTALLTHFLKQHGIEGATMVWSDPPASVRLELEAYFSGERRLFAAPLELLGTEFQKQVWEEVRQIPYGETVSYAEIAIRTGNRKAVRAVGGAVGSNPIPIIVPCHRVLGSNGNLTGYAYGVEIKERLLVHEGALLA